MILPHFKFLCRVDKVNLIFSNKISNYVRVSVRKRFFRCLYEWLPLCLCEGETWPLSDIGGKPQLNDKCSFKFNLSN